jgi:hypothetical protein
MSSALSSVPLEESFRVVRDESESNGRVEERVYSSIGEFAMGCVRDNQDVIDNVDSLNAVGVLDELHNPNLTRMKRVKIYARGIANEIMGGLGKALCYTIPINCYLLSPFVLKKQYVLRK